MKFEDIPDIITMDITDEMRERERRRMACRELEKAKKLNERAAELLLDPPEWEIGNPDEWLAKRDQWLKDAGYEGK